MLPCGIQTSLTTTVLTFAEKKKIPIRVNICTGRPQQRLDWSPFSFNWTRVVKLLIHWQEGNCKRKNETLVNKASSFEKEKCSWDRWRSWYFKARRPAIESVVDFSALVHSPRYYQISCHYGVFLNLSILPTGSLRFDLSPWAFVYYRGQTQDFTRIKPKCVAPWWWYLGALPYIIHDEVSFGPYLYRLACIYVLIIVLLLSLEDWLNSSRHRTGIILR